jgi:hypothetical protein
MLLKSAWLNIHLWISPEPACEPIETAKWIPPRCFSCSEVWREMCCNARWMLTQTRASRCDRRRGTTGMLLQLPQSFEVRERPLCNGDLQGAHAIEGGQTLARTVKAEG